MNTNYLTISLLVFISFSFAFVSSVPDNFQTIETAAPNEDMLQQCLPEDIKGLCFEELKAQQCFERMCLNG